MAKEKKIKKSEIDSGQAEPSESDTRDESADDAADSEKTSIDAIDIINGDNYIRRYSREIHGDDFQALADMFCTKKPKRGVYTQVPVGIIKKVEVRYREKEDAELHLDKQKPDSPIVDKVRSFEDPDEALSFSVSKFGSSVVVSKKK